MFEDRPVSNILWINALTPFLPLDQATYLMSGTASLALTALYSPQTIVLAEVFPLLTILKLLKLINQEDSFSQAFCSVIPSPEAVTTEYLNS